MGKATNKRNHLSHLTYKYVDVFQTVLICALTATQADG